MSSKLIRGEAIATEPVAWRRVSSSEAIAGDGQPASAISRSRARPRDPGAGDVEQRLRRPTGRASRKGKRPARQSLAAQVEAMQMNAGAQHRGTHRLAAALSPRSGAGRGGAGAGGGAAHPASRADGGAGGVAGGGESGAGQNGGARGASGACFAPGRRHCCGNSSSRWALPQRIEVIADASLAPGGVMLESSRGLLDASVDTQLSEIERGFADLVCRAHEPATLLRKARAAWRPAAGPAASPSWSGCWWSPRARKRRWATFAKSRRATGA